MTRHPPETEPVEQPAAAPSLHHATVGGNNVQITSARDVTVVSESAGRPVRRRSPVWLFVVGVVLAVGAVAFGERSTLADVAQDALGAPVLTAVTTSIVNVGDSFAMPDEFSTAEHALLLRAPSYRQLTETLFRHHAARLGTMNVVTVLRGRRHGAVRIIDVRPYIVRSGPPPTGTCLTIPAQGGGEEYKVKADLDHLNPRGGQSRFLPKSIDLAYGERVTVEFTVHAKNRWYEWGIEVVYAYKDSGETESAFFQQANGQPFRVTGEAPRYSVVYNDPSSFGVGYRITGRNQPCGRR
ncbi:hypothetical protein [Streptosporangium sp. NPDC020145]|uniref:hypothetical protein n=1 Tax=unclassified Streptosporangium TaxID=2632669 RepID=UPI0034165DCE